MIRDLLIEGSQVTFTIVLTTPACPLKAVMQKQSEEAIHKMVPGVSDIKINWDADVSIARRGGAAGTSQPASPLLPNVKNIIAVSSGKGGVGKSTVSVNIAVALAQEGAKVGLL